MKHRSESDRRSPEGERRSPSEDEADEKLSSAEIHNPEDYKAIFQPKNAICRWSRSVAAQLLNKETVIRTNNKICELLLLKRTLRSSLINAAPTTSV